MNKKSYMLYFSVIRKLVTRRVLASELFASQIRYLQLYMFSFLQERDPVFIARDFVVRFLCDETPLDILPNKTPGNSFHSVEENNKQTQVNFTVGCGNITQRVNLSFVRLVLQVVDMLDLLSNFISSSDGSEVRLTSGDPSLMSPEDRTDGVPPWRSKVPHGAARCWRIMYQVVDLYSSLPREAKNKGFLRRSTIGRVLGGNDTRLKLFNVNCSLGDAVS